MSSAGGPREENHRLRSSAAGAFVGRAAELAALLAGLEDALAGQGRLFVIAGDLGIGKSRLADEIASHGRARGARVLWGRCWEAGGAPAYWPWVQALRSQLREFDKDTLRAQLGPGAVHLAQILPEIRGLDVEPPAIAPADPDQARFDLFSAVVDLLRNMARLQPLLLILDDLHASDAPSLVLLQFVAGELAGIPVLVVVTYRDTALRPDHPLSATLAEVARHRVSCHIALAGLTAPDVGRCIEITIGRAPSAALVTAVHLESAGNPLFVGELARLLAQAGGLEVGDDAVSWRRRLPQGIKQVIGRRLSELSADCRRVLSVASVLGRDFEPEVLERVSELRPDRLEALLEEATSARVVTEAPVLGRLRFVHAAMRDSIYDDLPVPRRVRLHQRVGDALEALYARNRDPHLGELAFHFIEAIPAGEADRAVFYARAAGDQALRLLAYEEAVRLYGTALEALDLKVSADEPERCELLLSLGDARARAGDFPRARESFLRAADVARALHLPAQLARAALGYGGRFVWEAGRGDPHLAGLLDDALIALGTGDSTLRVRVMSRLAGGPLRDDREREPRALLSQQAVEMARRLGDANTLAYALDGRYAAVWWPDNLDERLAIATELIQAARDARDTERALQGHHYRCLALLERGDMAGVMAEVEVQARLAEELRQPAHHWYVAVVRATLATFAGRLSGSEELIAQGLALGQRAHGAMATVYHALQLFALRREQGRLEEQEPALRRMVYEFPTYPVLRCALALLYAELDREGDARVLFDGLAADDFTGVPLDDEWIVGLSLLADVAVRFREASCATALYRLLAPYAARNAVSNPDMCIGSVSRSLGILAGASGDQQAAARHLEDALAMNARTGGRPWLVRTQHDYAHLLLTRDGPDDRRRARNLLTEAMEVCRELGLVGLAGAVTRLLDAAPSSPGRRRVGGSVRGVGRPPTRAGVFRREGEYWSIAYEGDVFRLKDAKGLQYLARLLADPGRTFHVLDLAAPPGEGSASASPEIHGADLASSPFADAGAVLDAQAKSSYRRRLGELREELADAEARADRERMGRINEEMGFLLQQLAGAMGLGSRDRRALAISERARVNITRAVKAALLRIHRCSPALGRHLDTTIKTGVFCSYAPDPRVDSSWQV